MKADYVFGVYFTEAGSTEPSINCDFSGVASFAEADVWTKLDAKCVVVKDPKPAPTPAPSPSPAPSTPAPPPTPTPRPPAPTPSPSDACLCVFDIDRTLTGKQGEVELCPNNQIQNDVGDASYGGGTLTLSELGQNLHSTFCGGCYHGIVSAGAASGQGSKERDVLLQKLDPSRTLSGTWSTPSNVASSMVVYSPDGFKQNSVRQVVKWFREAHQITIENRNVYFFDDRADNVQRFAGTGFNAIQTSCARRDPMMSGAVGLCGSALAEVVRKSGVHICASTSDVMV